MRSSVYLFATAIIAATSTSAFATEMMIADSGVIVYGDAHTETAHETAYGNPYSEAYTAGEEVIYLDEATSIEGDYSASPADVLTYSPEIPYSSETTYGAELAYAPETVESTYAVEGIEDAPMSITETIDGIVYETVIASPQTY